MTASPQATGIYRFPTWELRRHERALFVNGVRAKIGSRAFDVLLALVERQGRVVSKAELIDAAWPDLVVEENNLSVQISTLRKLLGADSIANIAGQGYQLAATADPNEAHCNWPVFPRPAAKALWPRIRAGSATFARRRQSVGQHRGNGRRRQDFAGEVGPRGVPGAVE